MNTNGDFMNLALIKLNILKTCDKTKDIFLKLRILTIFLLFAWHDWCTEIWYKDLDSHYCCNGNMCACGGVSVREIYVKAK